jgi:hypothetical protein
MNSTIINKERKRKTVFTSDEDRLILDFVEKFGATRWERIEPFIKTRTSRQCRERYKNFLSPTVVKTEWTNDEDLLLENLVFQYGKKWSKLIEYFPGRTDVLIKNRFALLMRRNNSGKRVQNQNLFETVSFNNTTSNLEMTDFSEKLEDDTTFNEPVFDFSFENPIDTENMFSFDISF